VAETYEDLKTSLLTNFIAAFSTAQARAFEDSIARAKELAKEIVALEREHIRDTVDDARTEQLVNELLEKSKDKLHQTDIQRLKDLREARNLTRKQSAGDVELAERDLEVQRKVLENLGARVNRSKTLAEYTDDEFRALGANKDEIKKLGDLEAALFKVRADQSAKEKAFNKQEFQLVEEIRKAEEDRIFRAIEGERKLENAKLSGYITVRDLLINREELDLKYRLKLLQENVDDRGQILENEKDSQLAILKRAAEERIRAEGRLVTDEILENDKGFVKERLAIVEKYNTDVEGLARYNVDTLTKIYASYFQERRDNSIDANNEQIRIYQEAYTKGLFTLNQFNRAVKETNDKFQNEEFNNEATYLQKVID
jgi:hypothetical protein